MNLETTSSQPVMTLGTPSGLFGMTLSGAYGLFAGVINNGNVWMQVGRSDTTPTAYNLLLQPSGGNVGIGTTSPVRLLEVRKDQDAATQLRISNANSANGTAVGVRLAVDSASALGGLALYGPNDATYPDTLLLDAGSGISNGLRITTDVGHIVLSPAGNVGIGTTAPNATLNVVNSASGVRVWGYSADGTQKASNFNGQIEFGNTDAYKGRISFNAYDSGLEYMSFVNTYDSVNGGFIFRSRTAGTEIQPMVIKNSGNVGLGPRIPACRQAGHLLRIKKVKIL